eukprot:scaffold28001_cov83-Cyclotella_meneghiniana.AAC.1
MEGMVARNEAYGSVTNPFLPGNHTWWVLLRNSTGGTFSFTLSGPIPQRTNIVTAQIPHPPTVAQIEYTID